MICIEKKLNLIIRFSSAISPLNQFQIVIFASFAIREYLESMYFFSGGVEEHLRTKLLFYLPFASYSQHLIHVMVS